MVALSISRQAEYPPTGKPAKTGSRSSRADAVGPDAASASHRQELEANMSRDNAIVMRYDNPDIPSGRDIVYLHGRGSTEREAGFALPLFGRANVRRSEEHTSELQSLMRTSYAVFCLKKKKHSKTIKHRIPTLHIYSHAINNSKRRTMTT